MIRPRRPDRAEIDRFLAGHVDTAFSYADVGATADLAQPLPDSLRAAYAVDHHRFDLGRGQALFERARDALFAWRHFDIDWLDLQGRSSPVHTGQIVATLTQLGPLWFLTPCRVVFAQRDDDAHRAGFAYGTLAGHMLAGEERFVVSIDPASEQVQYEIAAFSRPASWLARLGRGGVRRLQRRFVAGSQAALRNASGSGD